MRLALAAALLILPAAASNASAQAAYPFVGKWDCEVATFTFTDKTYNNGSETLRMTKVTKMGRDYELTFPKNYKIMAGNFKGATMSWFSEASGDSFTCKKLK